MGSKNLKKVISASRRTDLVAYFPGWLASVLKEEKAEVFGPSGRSYSVDLRPEGVHTVVLWSKNFSSLIQNRFSLQDLLRKYGQLYLHFTVTGLGGSFIEKGVLSSVQALQQLEYLIRLSGNSGRVSVRFDPIVYWNKDGKVRTNLYFFEKMAPGLSRIGIKNIRFSFAQWYSKAKRRAEKVGFIFLDPPEEEKKRDASYLAELARDWGLKLHACSQAFLNDVPGIQPSACIDGNLLQSLHPRGEPASARIDKTQREECCCTESVDIGSYAQRCPHSCLYCYASPQV